MKIQRMLKSRLAVAVAGLSMAGFIAAPSYAFDFQVKDDDGDSVGRLDTTISVGGLWRTEGQDTELAATGDVIDMAAGGYSTQLNKNDANNNFDPGLASVVTKITSELSLDMDGGTWGVFARGSAFYDSRIMGGGHDGGVLNASAASNVNGFDRYATYSDYANNGTGDDFTKDAERYAGSRARLLDAYVWWNGDFFDRPLSIKAGQQVINWGEALFIQNGVNTANYIDLAALRLPGSEIKEALLPLDSILFSYGITDNLSADLFYQFEWKNSEDAPAGTFYSTHDAFPSKGADNVIVDGRLVALAVATPGIENIFAAYTAATYGAGYEYEATQVTVNRVNDIEAKDDGQYGLALRYFADALNGTEFGFYYTRTHDRLPVVAASLDVISTNLAQTIDNASYSMAYGEDTDMYGFSFNTLIGDVSLAGELAYRPKQKIINDVGDQLLSGLSAAAGVAFLGGTPTIGDLTEFGHCLRLDFGGDCLDLSTPIVQGQTYFAYDEAETITGSLVSIFNFGPTLGSDGLVALLELGMDSTHGLDDDLLYNSTAALLYSEALIQDADDPNNSYLDETAWGYRAVVRSTYNDVFAGLTMTPSIRIAHDVEGNSPIGGNFLEGRKAATFGLDFVYLNQFEIGMQATSFWGGGYSNKLKDRNNASLVVKYAF